MMGAAYVVVSHRDASQVGRLARAIRRSSPSSVVLVEHDARGGPPPAVPDPRVHVRMHGQPADWGSWELAEVQLGGLRRALLTTDAVLFVLISGQDYPVRSLRLWEQEVLRGPGAGWVTSWPLTYRPRWGRPVGEGSDDWTRYAYRWWRSPVQPSPRRVTHLVEGTRWVEPVMAWRVMQRGRGSFVGIRRWPAPFTAASPVYKGWTWMALSRPLLAAMLACWESDRRLQQVFRSSVVPDEGLLPTLARRTGLPLTSREVSYADWSDPAEAPAVLTMAQLEAIVASGAPFCRKVEPGRSAALLDALDASPSAH